MQKPFFLDELIDRASKVAGNDTKLAKELETSRQAVSHWRNNRKPCPAADIALMAAIAGLDAEAWTARAVMSPHEGTTKGAKLEAALKKALAATGGVIASSSVHAQTGIDGFHNLISDFIRCIFCKPKGYTQAL